jgi:hypothetical protein
LPNNKRTNVEIEIEIDPSIPTLSNAKQKRKYTKRDRCPHCNLTGHVQTRHNQCLKNPLRINNELNTNISIAIDTINSNNISTTIAIDEIISNDISTTIAIDEIISNDISTTIANDTIISNIIERDFENSNNENHNEIVGSSYMQNMFEYTINTQHYINNTTLNADSNLSSPIISRLDRFRINDTPASSNLNRSRIRTPDQVNNNNRISRERYSFRRNLLNMNDQLNINEFDLVKIIFLFIIFQ